MNILELLSPTISNLQADKENFLDFGGFKVSVCFPELVASHGKSKCTQLHTTARMRRFLEASQPDEDVDMDHSGTCGCFSTFGLHIHTLSHVSCLQATGVSFVLKALKNLTSELQLLPAMLDHP